MNLMPEYYSLTYQEKQQYFDLLGLRVLAHRYRYYVLDDSVVSDFEYDYIERYYEAIANDLKVRPLTQDLVGFSSSDSHCSLVKSLVDNNQDDYSKWVDTMNPIWIDLGLPGYMKTESYE